LWRVNAAVILTNWAKEPRRETRIKSSIDIKVKLIQEVIDTKREYI
jgi:hypothetical protein